MQVPQMGSLVDVSVQPVVFYSHSLSLTRQQQQQTQKQQPITG